MGCPRSTSLARIFPGEVREEDDDQSDLDSFKGDEVSRSRASTAPAASRAATPGGDDLVDEAMPEEMPKLVVSITGMTIEGARWDRSRPTAGAAGVRAD